MPRDLVLAFDTASENIALAVAKLTAEKVGQEAAHTLTLIASDDHPAARQANVQLMPSIDALFTAHALSVSDSACVVCGLGPGSFTGVRIGVATAKGIARGLGVPLYGVSTLDAVAWGAWRAGIRGSIGVVADAMRGEVYPARFDLDETGATRRDPHTVAKADEVAAHWRAAGEPLLLIGDGLKKFADAFAPPAPPDASDVSAAPPASDGTLPPAPKWDRGTREPSPCPLPPPSVPFTLGDETLWTPTGEGLLRAFEAACRAGQQGAGEAGTLLPLYTRLSDAEENERKRLATAGPIAQGAQVEVPLSGVADPSRLGQITYRPLAADDLDQVAMLEATLFPAGAQTSGECWTRAMFADELARRDRSWWVAREGNLLVGFAGGWVTDGVLQVLDVAVAPTHRRRGIAHDLLGRLMQDALDLGATRATLEVRESNTAACALYVSLGFERLGTRPGYYPSTNGTAREAALIMTAPLRSGTGGGSSAGQKGTVLLSRPLTSRNRDAGDKRTVPFCPAPTRPAPSSTPVPPSPRILAIETSCDETAAAVIDGEGRLLSDTVASQVDFHSRFGGVVPEIASRKHTEAIVGVVDAALEEAGLTGWHELDALAVTYAPGLIGALVVGVAFAKGLSWATGLPLIRVNHLEGHIYANRLAEGAGAHKPQEPPPLRSSKPLRPDAATPHKPQEPPPLRPPFIIALLSGGHTMLVHVRDWGDYQVLGQTLDDAVGEAFDKVAKALGLGYPGGPVIARLAQQGDPGAIDFPRALLHSHDYRFSLSGLKTAVITYIKKEREAGRELDLPAVAASFQQAVIDVQVAKALAALHETGCTTFCIGGGVAANTALRDAYAAKMAPKGIRVVFPPHEACTDNAAMIAAVALKRFAQRKFMNLADDAFAHADIEKGY